MEIGDSSIRTPEAIRTHFFPLQLYNSTIFFSADVCLDDEKLSFKTFIYKVLFIKSLIRPSEIVS